MDDRHKLLQLWVIVQIILQNTCLKTVSKAYMSCMSIGSKFVYAIASALCLDRKQHLPCCCSRHDAGARGVALLQPDTVLEQPHSVPFATSGSDVPACQTG